MNAILKFDFQKQKTITFFSSKLSKLHKKDPILHGTTTFSLQQGETRTNSGPIPHPLRRRNINSYYILRQKKKNHSSEIILNPYLVYQDYIFCNIKVLTKQVQTMHYFVRITFTLWWIEKLVLYWTSMLSVMHFIRSSGTSLLPLKAHIVT